MTAPNSVATVLFGLSALLVGACSSPSPIVHPTARYIDRQGDKTLTWVIGIHQHAYCEDEILDFNLREDGRACLSLFCGMDQWEVTQQDRASAVRLLLDGLAARSASGDECSARATVVLIEIDEGDMHRTVTATRSGPLKTALERMEQVLAIDKHREEITRRPKLPVR